MPVIVIEGLIGAGKSSLMKLIETFFQNNPHFFEGNIKQIYCFYEPNSAFSEFKQYNPLQLFYESPQQYAVPFQYYVIDSFSQFLKHTFDYRKRTETLYIYERSLFSCNVFINSMLENGLISHFSHDFLSSLITRNTHDLKFQPDAIFFLDISIEKALERIHQRGRAGEGHCNFEQLECLTRHYNTYLLGEVKKNIPVLKCNALQSSDDILHVFLNSLSHY